MEELYFCGDDYLGLVRYGQGIRYNRIIRLHK